MSLNAKRVESIIRSRKPGRYGDGGGLHLHVRQSGAAQWVLRTRVRGRRCDIGLGGAALVTLAEARTTALEMRRIARLGGDPLANRRKQDLNFREAASTVHRQISPTFKNPRHVREWISSLERHAFPSLGDLGIKEISTVHIVETLSPIWVSNHELARRVMQRIAKVFDWARSTGQFTGENPVRGAKMGLPNVQRSVRHRTALAWQDLPEFMAELSSREGVSARCLELLIHTASRSGEVRGASWGEVDWRSKTWLVPSARMKMNRVHSIPLSTIALELLAEEFASVGDVPDLQRRVIFPSPQKQRSGNAPPLSNTVFKSLFLRMGRPDLTAHGFRSSFRDWCGDNGKPRELAEAALAHHIGNEVERAYARSDLLERRRPLLEEWSRFLVSAQN